MAGPGRSRAANASYAEYSDDDFDSPVKKVGKKRVIESDDDEQEEAVPKQTTGILKFARPGVANTFLPEKGSSPSPNQKDNALNRRNRHKKLTRRPANDDNDEEMEDAIAADEDFIEDSSEDEVAVANRPRRAAATKPVAYAEPGASEEEEEEDEASLMDEDEDKSEDEDGSDAEELQEEEEDDAFRPRRTGRVTRAPSRSVAAAAAATRRSGRATAKPKNLNEDALHRQYYDSDEFEEEEEGGRQSRAARATARRARHSGSSSDDDGDENEDAFDSDAENQLPQAAPRRKAAPSRGGPPRRARPTSYIVDDDSDSQDSDGSSVSDSEDGHPKSSGSEITTDDENEDYDEEGGGMYFDGDNDNNSQGLDEDALATAVEKIMAVRSVSESGIESPKDQLHVKLTGKSYRRVVWISRSSLLNAGRQGLVRSFDKKRRAGELDPYGDLVDGVHPDWLVIDRVVSHKDSASRGRLFFVKWRSLGYSECTWEPESALMNGSEADKSAVERYFKFAEEAEKEGDKDDENCAVELDAMPTFCNGRALRDYQQDSLKWMVSHWHSGQNCILGDEMGLGKTAQSISVLAFQRQFGGVTGPFLVIAPLTTLGHWQREIETWTDMNCIVYAGSGADRALIQKYDLWVPGSSAGRGRRGRRVKPHVVLSSYETVLRDQILFQNIVWETIIIDEAHRMKSVGSSTRTAIADIPTQWMLLLTGTPVQNNMRELFGLLNLLDRQAYPDEASFLEVFGDDRNGGMTPAQVKLLQGALRPVLLRRMKEDVETLPEKEECIIWVQLTVEQRAYYKAIFEKQIGTLMAGASNKNMPNLRNLAMELRKVCCHPYLCQGLEDDIAARRAANGMEARDDISGLAEASGKMLLLHKLLPKLRAEGHKVLIFSQFKIMLDVLEDYMRLSGHPCERIDGSTSSRDRQTAIDRYSNPESDSFIFLLSTRAGGQGITLTAADTCIIYDSDWNPQNDLQAMARCHRIGQEKDVTIYRLVSRDTYEEHVFQTSSRKYGLDEAILGGIGPGPAGAVNDGGDPEADGKKIAELLKHGAHCLTAMDAAAKETEAFASEDIDEILKGRTEKRQIGGRAGNTFSVATFDVGGGAAGAAGARGDDKSFWSALLPEAAQAHEEARLAAAAPVILPPRKKKAVNYREATGKRRKSESLDGNDSDFKASPASDDDESNGSGSGLSKGKAGAKNPSTKAPPSRRWTSTDVGSLLDRLLRLGFSRHAQAASEAQLLGKHPSEEIAGVASGLETLLDLAVKMAPARPERVPSFQQEENAIFKSILLGNHPDFPDYNVYDPSVSSQEKSIAAKQAAAKLATARINDLKAQHVEFENRMKVVAHQLAPPTLEVPEAAIKAMREVKLAERLLRNGEKYVEHLTELSALADTVANNTRPPYVNKNKGMPYWWTHDDDSALLRGCYTLGWDTLRRKGVTADVEAILKDPRFGFTSKLAPAPVVEVEADAMETDTVEGGDAVPIAAAAPVAATEACTTAAAATIAAASSGPEGDSFLVKPSDDSAQQQQPAKAAAAAATSAMPVPAAPLQPTTLGSTQLMDPKKWAKMLEDVNKHTKLLLKALVEAKRRARLGETYAGTFAGMSKGAVASESEGGGPVSSVEGGSSASGSGSIRGVVTGTASGTVGVPQRKQLLKQVLHRSMDMDAAPIQKLESSPPIDLIEDSSEEEKDEAGGAAKAEKPPPCALPPSAAAAPAAGGGTAKSADGTPGMRIPALNVFEETRGEFTDPALLASGGSGSGSGSRPNLAAATAGAGPSAEHKNVEQKRPGGSVNADDPNGMRRSKQGQAMRQRSLFEMDKLKRMKRTADGLQEVLDGDNVAEHVGDAGAPAVPMEAGRNAVQDVEQEVVDLLD